MARSEGQIMKQVLIGIAVIGAVIVVGAITPNLFAALGAIGGFKQRGYNSRQIYKSFTNLKRRKLVYLGQKGDKIIIELTEAGKKRLLTFDAANFKLKPQKRWDRKWRIVIFDIPEKYKLARTVFARKLKELGFIMLQKSVWVHPFPCEEEIEVLKGLYEIEPFVKLVTAEQIDSQNQLIKKFNL